MVEQEPRNLPIYGFKISEIYVCDENGEKIDEDWKGALNEWLMKWSSEEDSEHPVLCPAEVYSTEKYAPYVEFGTGPAKQKITEGESLEEIITPWIEERLGISRNDPEFAAMLEKMLKHIRRDGIHPQPYLRPAAYDVLDRECAEGSTYLETRGHSIYSLCETIAEEAKRMLVSNETSWHGTLQSSIKAELIKAHTFDRSSGEVVLSDRTGLGPNETDQMWDSRDLGVPGPRGGHKRAKYHKDGSG